jgi:ABC-2 type transport system permease protein
VMRFMPLAMGPKIQIVRNLPRSEEGASRLRVLTFATLGVGFWLLIFFGTRFFVAQCLGVELLGELIARRLLDFVFVMFFAVLLMSNINTAISTFYLADDLQLLNSLPVRRESFFLSRFVETLANSSWHVFIFGTPVLVAYGVTFQEVFRLGLAEMAPFYATAVAAFVPFFAIPTAVAIVLVTVLVNVFPARRLREGMLLLLVLMVAGLLVYVRFLRPERFLNPEGFQNFQRLVADFRAPAREWLPSTWMVEALYPRLKGQGPKPGYLALVLSTAGFLYFSTYWLCAWVYDTGYSRAQEGRQNTLAKLKWLDALIRMTAAPYSGVVRQFVTKDLRVFLREPTQWTQLLLLLALVLIYIINAQHFRTMGESGLLGERGLHFLNTGLVAFMSTSVAVRFVYPAVSLEGRSYWIVRTAPITLEQFLWGKFYVYALPLLLLSIVFSSLSGYFLGTALVYRVIAVVTIAATTLMSVGMGVGFGALFPRFHVENIAKIAQGYGGLTYMLVCMTTIMVVVGLTYFPLAAFVSTPTSPAHLNPAEGAAGLAAVLAILVAGAFVPMKLGARALARREGP